MEKKISTKIEYLHADEAKGMPIVSMQVTKAALGGKNAEVKRDVYQAMLRFDWIHQYKLTISNDDYSLLYYCTDREYVGDQFNLDVHARILETQWPERNGRAAHVTHVIQIFADEDLKWEFDITGTKFMKSMLKANEKGKLLIFKPVVIIPGDQAKEEKVEDKKKPIKEDKLPF